MIVPAQLRQKHSLFRPYLSEVESRVQQRIFAFCADKGYAFVGRLKNTESLFEKIETGRFGSWSGLDDLYGCSIVIPFLDAEEEVLEWLNGEFSVTERKLRGETQKDPAIFRFDATRIVARLKASEFIEESRLTAVSFEVQIRTAFEHAWSVATHSLAYKGERVDWSRLRLAAQLKASVEQLDMLVLGFDSAASAIHQQRWPEIAIRSKIESVFRQRIEAGTLPEEVEPASWMRFCENVQRLILSTTNERMNSHKAQRFVEARLDIVARALDEIGGKFPRSISLLQFCIAALTESGQIQGTLNNYTPFISEELRTLYPKTAIAGDGFDLEFTGV